MVTTTTTPTAGELPAVSGHAAKTARILHDAGLEDKLARSICLSCQNATLAIDSRCRAVLYCHALYRDVTTEIVNCTSHVARPE